MSPGAFYHVTHAPRKIREDKRTRGPLETTKATASSNSTGGGGARPQERSAASRTSRARVKRGWEALHVPLPDYTPWPGGVPGLR